MSTTRTRLADVQLRALLTSARATLALAGPDTVRVLLTDDLALLEQAIAIVRIEAERLGWMRAASHYGVAQVAALTDWELTRGEAVAEREAGA